MPGAPAAHWAMNMQCLSSNTQVRWRQPLLEQQLPGGRADGRAGKQCVQCSLRVSFQAWDLLAFVSATLFCSTLVSCGAQKQVYRP